jgi:hypothetical protein
MNESRESILNIISDVHKDAYGFRPRGVNYAEMSDDELEAEFNYLCDAAEAAVREEEAAEARALEEFEAEVSLMLSHGAGSRPNALAWMLDARDLNDYANLENGYIDDYVNYSLGIAYRYDLFKGENKY